MFSVGDLWVHINLLCGLTVFGMPEREMVFYSTRIGCELLQLSSQHPLGSALMWEKTNMSKATPASAAPPALQHLNV
jgi:hypothetical protein